MLVDDLQETSAITAVYCWASMLIKLSLCVFFRRIFLPSRVTNILTWIGILLTTISYTAFFIAWVYYSVPHAGEAWADITFNIKVGLVTPKLSVGVGVVGVVTDFYIIVIPLLAIYGLNMSQARKLGLMVLFATGLLYDLPHFPTPLFYFDLDILPGSPREREPD